ncbi:MAG: hypothetical protein JWN76_687 [Chitinophagaceae bacterium]|nr:hypothetical protein [Chitinophagaceae bacterium]
MHYFQQYKNPFVLIKTFLCIAVIVTVVTSCKKYDYVSTVEVPNQSFSEEFDTMDAAYSRGWRFVNRSLPLGNETWSQGNILYFNAYSQAGVAPGSPYNAGYAVATAYATTGTNPEGLAVISNWLVSPPVTMQNGDKIIFYARDTLNAYVDRLQLRINPHNESIEAGSGKAPGSFDVLLLDINPKYFPGPDPNAMPENWTRFEATISGLAKAVTGRFAFRQFLEGGGPGNTEYGGILGIDHVQYLSISK